MTGAARQPLRKPARRYHPGPAFRLSGMGRIPDRDRGGSDALLRSSVFRRRPESGIAQTSSNRLGKAERRVSHGDIYSTLHLASGSTGERRLSSTILSCNYHLYTLRRSGRDGRPAGPGDRVRQRCILWTEGARRPDAGPLVNGAGGRAKIQKFQNRWYRSQPLLLPALFLSFFPDFARNFGQQAG